MFDAPFSLIKVEYSSSKRRRPVHTKASMVIHHMCVCVGGWFAFSVLLEKNIILKLTNSNFKFYLILSHVQLYHATVTVKCVLFSSEIKPWVHACIAQ